MELRNCGWCGARTYDPCLSSNDRETCRVGTFLYKVPPMKTPPWIPTDDPSDDWYYTTLPKVNKNG